MEVSYLKYFAYGSNMSLSKLNNLGVEYTNVKPALLKGWELVFTVSEQKKPGYAYASVVPNNTKEVRGLLIEISPQSLLFLDEYEGYPIDYLTQNVRVSLLNGKNENCFMYVGNHSIDSPRLKPIPEHWKIIQEAWETWFHDIPNQHRFKKNYPNS